MAFRDVTVHSFHDDLVVRTRLGMTKSSGNFIFHSRFSSPFRFFSRMDFLSFRSDIVKKLHRVIDREEGKKGQKRFSVHHSCNACVVVYQLIDVMRDARSETEDASRFPFSFSRILQSGEKKSARLARKISKATGERTRGYWSHC